MSHQNVFNRRSILSHPHSRENRFFSFHSSRKYEFLSKPFAPPSQARGLVSNLQSNIHNRNWYKYLLGAGLGYFALNTLNTSEEHVLAQELAKVEKNPKIDKKQKKRLKTIFNKFASQKDENGYPLMTPEDFIVSVLRLSPIQQQREEEGEKNSQEPRHQQVDTSHLKLLFNMADTNETGKINLNEYILLFKLLTTPEREFEVLFRMFDVNKDGVVTKEEFKQVMLRNKEHINVDFDFDCDLMVRFFGRDGKSELSFTQFAQFMKHLQEEVRRQEFYQLDSEGKGYITAKQFGSLITAYIAKGHISQKLLQNVEKLKESYGNVRITFAEFDAFNRVMSNITSIATFLRTAEKDGVISRESFSRAAKSVAGISLSPLEISIIFRMFASKEDDKLYKEDYEEFIRTVIENEERRQKVYDMWVKDEIEPTTFEELSWLDKTMNTVIKFTLKVLYGGIAGAIGATAVYPIDLVKTRMQNQRFSEKSSQLYANSIDCFKKTIKHEGFKGLYRGLIPQLIGVAPEKAIKLVTNDFLRDLFGKADSDEIYLPLEILAGGGAGGSQVVFTNPIEIVKIRLQVQGEIARETGQQPKSAVQIMRELGFTGLYRGASACFARDIPFSALYFPTYAKLKEMFRGEDEKETSKSGILLAGSIAGAIAASSTTPLDVIKTRLQVEARAGQDTYNGIVDCFMKVMKKEGPTAFWKGVLPRTCRSSPQFGVTLLAYEVLHKFINPNYEDKRHQLAAGVVVEEDDLEALREIYLSKTKGLKKFFGGTKQL